MLEYRGVDVYAGPDGDMGTIIPNKSSCIGPEGCSYDSGSESDPLDDSFDLQGPHGTSFRDSDESHGLREFFDPLTMLGISYHHTGPGSDCVCIAF